MTAPRRPSGRGRHAPSQSPDRGWPSPTGLSVLVLLLLVAPVACKDKRSGSASPNARPGRDRAEQPDAAAQCPPSPVPPACSADNDCEGDPHGCVVGRCRSGICVGEPVAEGSACDDSNDCTLDDACHGGVCGGAPRACPEPGPCDVGLCTRGRGCSVERKPNGTECAGKGSLCYDGKCLGETVLIPGGTFPMGSPDGEGEDQEHPMHQVTLSTFRIDRYEVTNAQYARFLNAKAENKGGKTHPDYFVCPEVGSPCSHVNCGWNKIACGESGYTVVATCQRTAAGDRGSCDDHPVTVVGWLGAYLYCRWVDKRLPSEAEWERAANGPGGPDGTTWRRFPWSRGFPAKSPEPPGNECPVEFNLPGFFEGCTARDWTPRCNCGESDCNDHFVGAAPVGSFPLGASAEGVHDLAGNVWEWMMDDWTREFYGTPAATAKNPVNVTFLDLPEQYQLADQYQHDKVRRGGAYGYMGRRMRVADRESIRGTTPADTVGFRCATYVYPRDDGTPGDTGGAPAP